MLSSGFFRVLPIFVRFYEMNHTDTKNPFVFPSFKKYAHKFQDHEWTLMGIPPDLEDGSRKRYNVSRFSTRSIQEELHYLEYDTGISLAFIIDDNGSIHDFVTCSVPV